MASLIYSAVPSVKASHTGSANRVQPHDQIFSQMMELHMSGLKYIPICCQLIAPIIIRKQIKPRQLR